MSPTTPANNTARGQSRAGVPPAPGQAGRLSYSRGTAEFLALLLGAASLQAQTLPIPNRDSTTNALPAFEVKTLREGGEGFGPFYRAYVTIGTNKAAFLVPQGYQMKTDAQSWRVTLTEPQGRATITILFYAPQPAPQAKAPGAARELKPEPCLGILLKRHPEAKLIEELTATAAGSTGPAFELTLRNAAGAPQLARAAFFPLLTSLVEFEVVGNADTFEEARGALNTVLLTFRVSENGKLEIAPISDKL